MFMLVKDFIFMEGKKKEKEHFGGFWDLKLMIKDRRKSLIVEGPQCCHNLGEYLPYPVQR